MYIRSLNFSKRTNSFIKSTTILFIRSPFSTFAFILESLRGRKIITLYIIQIRNFTIKSRILHTDESNGRWSFHVSSFFFFFSFVRFISFLMLRFFFNYFKFFSMMEKLYDMSSTSLSFPPPLSNIHTYTHAKFLFPLTI